MANWLNTPIQTQFRVMDGRLSGSPKAGIAMITPCC
jgi:hypothetical protein